jgi:alpha-mannosidase
MSTAQALLQVQIAIHLYSTMPSVENLANLHRALFVAKSILPTIVSIPVGMVEIPRERIAIPPRILGDAWRSVQLDRFYRRLIQTCTEQPAAQSVAVRIETTQHVFTEVLIGRILLPIQTHFEKYTTFEHAYTHVVEPVFLYFVATEGKPYKAEDAFRAATSHLRHELSQESKVMLISVLETYDTSRFRTSHRKGTVHIMFNPNSTRSERDLSRDYYIERFNAVRAERNMLRFQPTRPNTPEDEQFPDVVSDVFASVFGSE